MKFRTFLGGIALAISLSWLLGVSISKHIEKKDYYGIPDSLLIDGMPECEAR